MRNKANIETIIVILLGLITFILILAIYGG
jgi:hypothetical protein